MLVATMAGYRAANADEPVKPVKMAQKLVHYQDTPHSGQACATCVQFQPPSSCKVVEGTISPAGWCELYVKKTG
jgi:High potential iron-sulfur protein